MPSLPVHAGTQAADLTGLHYFKHDAANAWAPLRHLQGLTWLALARAHGNSLPAELAACTALVELDASKAHGLDSSEAAWAPIARLPRLAKLSGARGPGAFAQLPLSLLDLELRGVGGTGKLSSAGEDAFDPLSRATALTRLHIGCGCDLQRMPRALYTLHMLRELLLSDANLRCSLLYLVGLALVLDSSCLPTGAMSSAAVGWETQPLCPWPP